MSSSTSTGISSSEAARIARDAANEALRKAQRYTDQKVDEIMRDIDQMSREIQRSIETQTAAIIANCDLIITSDTSVAHLAGGMGKNTWLLLHQVPDWRWGLTGDRSFWYPSMRLFRQQERSNWKEVIERVARSLQEYLEDDSKQTD